MIKLATVFSGIGAIEHALQRMGLEHKIVFACDNGDLDIFVKEIGMDMDLIGAELTELNTIISKLSSNEEYDELYKEQLESMLLEAQNEYEQLKIQLNSVVEFSKDTEKIIDTIIAQEGLKKAKIKEYTKLKDALNSGSEINRCLGNMQAVLKLTNDFKKDNALTDLGSDKHFVSSDGIDWGSVSQDLKNAYDQLESVNGKRIIRKVQDLSQRTGQLHEKIIYMKIQRELASIGDDWAARKAKVDELYHGLENRNKVKQSYMANYELDEEHFHWNVAFLDGRQYKDEVDLFVGGSPCQSFSLVGKQRGLEDTRGTLFYEYARLIDEIKPKVFIYENVRAVTSHDGGKTWEKMQQVFSELGYTFDWKILNAKDYGIPQNRERLFVVGFRNDLKLEREFTFPEPIELEKKMKDFLMENAPGGYFLPKKGVEFVTKEKNLTKKFTQIDGDIQLCQKKNQQFN